jgi:hypothetical protein
MPSTLAVLATLAALGVASPVEPRSNVKFTVPQVATGNKKIAAPPLALIKAVAKYNKGSNDTAPSVVKAAAAAAVQSGTVTAVSVDVRIFQEDPSLTHLF